MPPGSSSAPKPAPAASNAAALKSEAATRKQFVDKALASAGWSVIPHDPSAPPSSLTAPAAVAEYPTAHGPADYALIHNGQILAIVEAKKLSLGPQNVLTQAERYSKGITQPALNHREFGVPFLYSTNGEVIWHHDIRHPQNRSRQISGFHTPDALAELLAREIESAFADLLALPHDNPRLNGRPYQHQADADTEAALATARKRQMLLAMATGTGKTVTLVNQIYRLMKTSVAKRILFLLDRRALAAQAVRTFS